MLYIFPLRQAGIYDRLFCAII